MRPRRGVALTEVVLASAVLLMVSMVLYDSVRVNYRHATMTRGRMLADMLTTSFFQEVHGHVYGRPAPPTWPDNTPIRPGWQKNTDSPNVVVVPCFIEGLPSRMFFYRQVSFANGSVVGRRDDNWDNVTLTITWEEGSALYNRKTLTSTVLVDRP